MRAYEELFIKTDKQNSPKMCSELNLNKNRMSVITNFVAYSKQLWQSANCDQCYDEISTEEQKFSNSTIQFNALHDQVMKCISDTSKRNSSAVCTDCQEDYNKLNIIYDHIKSKSADKICFDLEDKVKKLSAAKFSNLIYVLDEQNATRLVWTLQMLQRQARLSDSLL